MTVMELKQETNQTTKHYCTFMITNSKIQDGRNNNKYTTGVVCDKTGSMEFKIWSAVTIESGLYDVECAVNIYNGRLSLIISSYTKSSKDPGEYVRKGSVDANLLIESIKQISDETIRKFVGGIFKKYWDRIKVAPAAVKHHQNYMGGLVEHLHGMFQTEKGIIYPDNVNRDLVLAGIALHDIGKLYTYKLGDSNEVEKTPWLDATDHIAISIGILFENLPEELRMDERFIKLGHVIAASHTQKDWGAIVNASSAEAKILGSLDLINSAMYSNEI